MKARLIKETTDIAFYSADIDSVLELPFVKYGVTAGFPSPADDFLEESIDLNKELVANPTATFLARIKGDSMLDDGIEHGDIAVIDRSIAFGHNKRVLAYLDGGFVIKRLSLRGDKWALESANSNYTSIELCGDDSVRIWGVVTWILKKFV